MTSTASITTYLVEDRLPWPDDGNPTVVTGQFDTGAIYDSRSRYGCLLRKVSALGATVRAELTKSAGDRVALELGTGQRPAGTVAWVSGGDAGIRFDQPVDVLALINRSLVSQPAERRRMPRVELRCAAHVKFSGTFQLVMMRNISPNGVQIEGDDLPARGTFVSLFVEGLIVPAGEVVWRKDNLAGIELLDDLSWTSILPWIRQMLRNGVH
jgi:hypothetical protein